MGFELDARSIDATAGSPVRGSRHSPRMVSIVRQVSSYCDSSTMPSRSRPRRLMRCVVEECRQREGLHSRPVVSVVISRYVADILHQLLRRCVAGSPLCRRGPRHSQHALHRFREAMSDCAQIRRHRRGLRFAGRFGNPRRARRIPSLLLVQNGQAVRGCGPCRRDREQRVTEGVTVEQFGEQNHRLRVAVVRPRPSHVERDDNRIAGGFDEQPDHAVQRPMDVEQCGSGRRGRRMRVERMAGVNSVP